MAVQDLAGAEVGIVTSGTFSPTLKVGIALALLNSEIKLGDTVQIDIRGRISQATVVKAPFVESKVR